MVKLDNLTVLMPVANGDAVNQVHLERALTALVQGVSHIQLLIVCNGDYKENLVHQLERWRPMLARNAIEMQFKLFFHESTSLAHMAQWAFGAATRPWVMNHDVDLMSTPQLWEMLAYRLGSTRSCIFYNFVDVHDRGFPGWTGEPLDWGRSNFMRAQYGDHGLVYHEWRVSDGYLFHLHKVTKVWAGSYILRTDLVCASTELQAELASFRPGQRGYDRVITRRFQDNAEVMLGATAYHWGTDALMGRNFSEYHPLVQPDLQHFMKDHAPC